MPGFKKVARFVLDTKMWMPANAAVLYKHSLKRQPPSGATDEQHIIAAVDWLKRAQDSTGNNGVAGRYLLGRGWTESYPETSGYIIPTLVDVGKRFDDPDCHTRGKRIADFLYSVQMDCGSFPGGEYNKSRKLQPSVFNTGQIMSGLLSWYATSGETAALDSVSRAARWLIEVQEEDGSWERFTYGTIKASYHSRVAWPLIMYGKLVEDNDSLRAAARFIEWTLNHTNPDTGWVSRMDFRDEYHKAERSNTHTLAYTYRGMLEYAMITDRQDVIDLVNIAAENMIAKFERNDYLSGILDSKWNNVADFVCLTANCQLAIILLKLYQLNNNERFLKSTRRLLGFVKSCHILRSSNGGIKGGVSGSVPIWGGYIRFGYPNWAAKFLIDALMLLNRVTEQSETNDTTPRV